MEDGTDDEHEDADCRNQGGGKEKDDACLCPQSGAAHLSVELLVDGVAFFIFFVHDGC